MGSETNLQHDVPALPRHLSWFAIWRWKRSRLWLLFLAMLVSYPLSAGPVIWLHDRQRLPQFATPIIQVVYFPLGLVCSYSKVCGGIFSSYLDFWESLP